jgi:hypothetical protein
MSWLAGFSESIVAMAGGAVRNEVRKGCEKLGPHPPASQRADWIKHAMERLNALVDAKRAQRLSRRFRPLSVCVCAWPCPMPVFSRVGTHLYALGTAHWSSGIIEYAISVSFRCSIRVFTVCRSRFWRRLSLGLIFAILFASSTSPTAPLIQAAKSPRCMWNVNDSFGSDG